MDIPVVDLVRLALGAVTTFLAIILWSRTRDVSWMFIVLATIMMYGEVMYGILDRTGILGGAQIVLWGTPLPRLIFSGLPLIFLLAAFIFMLRKTRR